MAKKTTTKKTSKTKQMKELSFKEAFHYPFNRPTGMLNILWFLLPIFGWFALGGYSVRIVEEFFKGKFKQLPTFAFKDDMKLGFFMFLKAIPFMLCYLIIVVILTEISGYFEILVVAFEILALPILGMNFIKKQTVQSFFEFNVIKVVFENFKDYLMVIVKSIGLAIIFFIMIIILVGIPASAFTKSMFIADFYRRNVK